MIPIEKIKGDIIRQNYSEIYFPMSHLELNNAMDSFLEFLKLPIEIKRKMYFDLEPNHPGNDVGYVCRSGENGKDDKEYFHYHEFIEQEGFEDQSYKDNGAIQNFLDYGRKIFDTAVKTVDGIVQILDTDYPGLRDRFFDKEKYNNPRHNFTLRFLKYNIKNPEEILAKGHYDCGTFTLALAESAPGLRIGRDPQSLKEVEHKEYTALFFPSLGLEKITDESFTPAWHDVVKRGEDSFDDEISRWAIVFFADAQNMPLPTEEETHPIW